jgi:hypothetical protein
VQLLTEENHLELTIAEGSSRVVGRLGLERPPVPYDDVAAAVFAGRYGALEVVIAEGMVFHMEGGPLDRRVQARALGDCPADQDAVDLEPEVVVESAGAVPLDDEPAADCGAGSGPAGPRLARIGTRGS